MAELFVQMSVSLDGFVEDGDGAMDWFAGGEAFDQILTATVRMIDGIVFGRKAYDLGAAFWPTAHDIAETPAVADQIDLMNSLPKYVLTHGALDTSWRNSQTVDIDAIVRLNAQTKPHWLCSLAPAQRRACSRQGWWTSCVSFSFPCCWAGAGRCSLLMGGGARCGRSRRSTSKAGRL